MAFNIFKKDKEVKGKKPAPVASSDLVQPEKTISLPSQSVLKYPYVSEKSTQLQALGQYVFVVSPTANKSEIKKQVAKQYDVKVRSVRMISLPDKSRNVGRYSGFKAGLRKAIVILEKDQTIEQLM